MEVVHSFVIRYKQNVIEQCWVLSKPFCSQHDCHSSTDSRFSFTVALRDGRSNYFERLQDGGRRTAVPDAAVHQPTQPRPLKIRPSAGASSFRGCAALWQSLLFASASGRSNDEVPRLVQGRIQARPCHVSGFRRRQIRLHNRLGTGQPSASDIRQRWRNESIRPVSEFTECFVNRHRVHLFLYDKMAGGF